MIEWDKVVWEGLAGALLGGLAGAGLTVYFDGQRKRREMSMKILERMVEVTHEIAQIQTMLKHPDRFKDDPPSINRVLAIGNWFDIVAAICFAGVADVGLIESVGMKKEMLIFLKSGEKAGRVIPKFDEAIREDWTRLKSFTNFEWEKSQEAGP